MSMLVTWTILTAVAAPPGDEATWESVRDDIVFTECTEVDGTPWCRATGLIGASVTDVAETLATMKNHADKFELVRSIVDLGDDTLHITIDYPSLFSDRDYVAKYTTVVEGEVRRVSWVAVEHPQAPPKKGTVRLADFGGEWRLEPNGTNTKVRYLWQADPGGSFPNWAKPLARKRAGYEALKDLAAAQGSELVER